MSLPVYLQGPPAASQIWSTKFFLNLASRFGSDAVALKKLLMRLSAATRPTKSSTTATIAFLPPRLLYNVSLPAAGDNGASASQPASSAGKVYFRIFLLGF